MSVEHTSRLCGVVKAHLKTIAFGQDHGFTVSQSTVPQADAQGNINGIGPGWYVTVSIPHPRPPLKGPRPDIASCFPLAGVLPPDEHFTQIAERLLKNCLEERDKINATPAAVGMDLTGLKF